MANYHEHGSGSDRTGFGDGDVGRRKVIVVSPLKKKQGFEARIKGELVYAHGISRQLALDELLERLARLRRPSRQSDYTIEHRQ